MPVIYVRSCCFGWVIGPRSPALALWLGKTARYKLGWTAGVLEWLVNAMPIGIGNLSYVRLEVLCVRSEGAYGGRGLGE